MKFGKILTNKDLEEARRYIAQEVIASDLMDDVLKETPAYCLKAILRDVAKQFPDFPFFVKFTGTPKGHYTFYAHVKFIRLIIKEER